MRRSTPETHIVSGGLPDPDPDKAKREQERNARALELFGQAQALKNKATTPEEIRDAQAILEKIARLYAPESESAALTIFPEEKVRELPPVNVSLDIIQKTGKEIGDMVETEGMKISRYLLENETPRGRYKTFEQTRLKKPETIHLVRLTVNDMFGDGKNHTTQEIWDKAKDLGLELCPPEVGPLYRIAYKDQPQGEYLRIAMEQIAGFDGNPRVFDLRRVGSGVWLVDRWAGPGRGWDPGDTFVFRLRK